ncbi:MAG: insulinase family protein [Cyclobacteriaceae bacterium]|nr:insulinase family protein [Cyclobacteriaceae bacterium]
MREYELIELANGIRVVHLEVSHTKIAHVGIMLDIGSRDERPEEQGLAHFWEHMAFKGTKKRKSFHIINRLETLGGELNAYTTKEKICFYASVLDNHLDKAVELLADITFHSTFPEKQIEKERMVILEEMAMYRDTPEDAIMDEFDELVFSGHALGTNILGTEETVQTFGQDHFLNFIGRNLNTTKIIFTSVGNYPVKKLEKMVRKYMADIPCKNHTPERLPFVPLPPKRIVKQRSVTQVHHMMGRASFALNDPKRIPFFMLTNILGGPAMNSRLNMSLREKHGFVYGVEAHFSPYTDTGLFSIAFATDPKNHKKAIALIEREIHLLKTQSLTDTQLHKAKQQLKGQLAMSEENNNSMMLMMAKSLLDMQTVPGLDKLFQKIDSVSAHDLLDLANESWDWDEMSSLTFMPE